MKLDCKYICPDKKEKIAQIVIEVLNSRFINTLETEGYDIFPFLLKHSFPKEYINMKCWLQGLTPTISHYFLENVVQILCDGEKKGFKGVQIYNNQIAAINNYMNNLIASQEKPSIEKEKELINKNNTGARQVKIDLLIDSFYKTDNNVVAIDILPCNIYSGEIRGEKQKILEAKAVLKELYPTKEIKYYFGFPFDPTSDTNTGYDKNKFLNYLVEARKFIDQSELLIADEFWSFLLCRNSGVMQEILDIINTIATPDFMTKYNAIQNKTNGYEDILSEWYLFSEREIFDRRNNIDSTLQRVLSLSIFNVDGSYNKRRLYLRQ